MAKRKKTKAPARTAPKRTKTEKKTQKAADLFDGLGPKAAKTNGKAASRSRGTGESGYTAHDIEVLEGLGNTAIVYEALRSGRIDVYPEYLGTIDLEILKNSRATSLEAINRQLAPLGLGVAVPLGFNDGYALAVRDADDNVRMFYGVTDDGLNDEWRSLVAAFGDDQDEGDDEHDEHDDNDVNERDSMDANASVENLEITD